MTITVSIFKSFLVSQVANKSIRNPVFPLTSVLTSSFFFQSDGVLHALYWTWTLVLCRTPSDWTINLTTNDEEKRGISIYFQ